MVNGGYAIPYSLFSIPFLHAEEHKHAHAHEPKRGRTRLPPKHALTDGLQEPRQRVDEGERKERQVFGVDGKCQQAETRSQPK
jgi:hypothetical protein